MVYANKVLVLLRERKVDHDGYCSDGDNEAEMKVIIRELDIPSEVDSYPWGNVVPLETLRSWFPMLEEEEDLEGESYYCHENTTWDDLDRHTRKIDIVSGIVIFAERPVKKDVVLYEGNENVHNIEC